MVKTLEDGDLDDIFVHVIFKLQFSLKYRSVELAGGFSIRILPMPYLDFLVVSLSN